MDTAPHASERFVFGYARNSDDPQEIARQETTIRERHKTLPDGLSELELVIFYDEGISGWSGKPRPGFEQMKRRTDAGEAAGTIIDTSSRLTRQGIEEALSILFGMKKVNCRLFTTTGKEYTADLYGVILLSVDAQRDNDYSSDLSHNISTGIAEKAREGRPHYGRLPPGFRRIDGRLVHTEDAALIKSYGLSFLRDRVGYAKLAELATSQLSEDGRKNLKDGVVNGERIRAWLSNPLYVGDMPHLDEVYEGKHEAIFDRETFDAIQRRIAVLTAENHREPSEDPWCLAGIVKCLDCRASIAHHSRRGGLYNYARGRTDGCYCKKTAWRAATLECNVIGMVANIVYACGDLLVSMPDFGLAPREAMTADEAREKLAEKNEALEVFAALLKTRTIPLDDPDYLNALAERDQAEQALDHIATTTASYREELAELVARWASLALDAPPPNRHDDDYGVEVIYEPTGRHFSAHGVEAILRGWQASDAATQREVITATLDRAYVSQKTVDLRFRTGIPIPIVSDILLATGRGPELVELEESGWGKRLENGVFHKPRSL